MTERPEALRQRLRQIIARLRRAYPDAKTELVFSNPLELLVATILSAQCTDVQVNKATPELFKRFRTAADYAKARVPTLIKLLSRINFRGAKANNLKAAGKILVARHGGKVPETMEELVELPGVGRKTANVVLGNAFDKQIGIVVDTHVMRLSGRLGLTKHQDPVKIEADLMPLVPRKLWTLFSHLLIFHGRRRCFARRPDCRNCEVLALCPSGPKFIKQGLAKN